MSSFMDQTPAAGARPERLNLAILDEVYYSIQIVRETPWPEGSTVLLTFPDRDVTIPADAIETITKDGVDKGYATFAFDPERSASIVTGEKVLWAIDRDGAPEPIALGRVVRSAY